MILCGLKTKNEIALGPTCFYVGYIRKVFLLFSPGCFSGFNKNVGGGLDAGPQVFVGMLRPI